MKIVRITEIEPRVYAFVCPLCGRTYHETPRWMLEVMPEFAICNCDRREEEHPTFRIFDKDGKKYIERLKYPRFVGEITFGTTSDIEKVELIDVCTDAAELARAMRQAGEFMVKRSRTLYGTENKG